MTGLVGWWPLNEDNGNTAYDLSGRENHGTIQGPVPAGTRGKGGLTAYWYDGVDDMTDVGTLGLGDLDQATVSAWVRQDGISDTSQHQRVVDSGHYLTMWVNHNSGDTYVRLGASKDTNGAQVGFNTGIQKGEYYHLTFVYDKDATDHLKLYVDGELFGTNSEYYGSITNENPFAIGNSGGSRPWFGGLNDIRVYDRALSAEEIRTLYQWGHADRAQPPTDGNAYWALDDDFDTTTAVDSWTKKDGTINGAVYTTGIRGQALNFDGTDDYVEIGDVMFNTWEKLTVSLWARVDTLPSNSSPSGHGGSDEAYLIQKCGSYNDNFGTTVATGGTAFYLDNGTSDSNILGPAPDESEWYHYIFRYDGSDMSIHMNGEKVAEAAFSGTLDDTANPLQMGARTEQSMYTNGIIDDVRVYNRALTPWEIHELYRYGTRGRDMRQLTVNQK